MDIKALTAGMDLSGRQIAKLARNLAAIDNDRLQVLADSASRAEQGSTMTRQGLDLLAKGIAGKQIIYTKAVIGDSTRNGELVELTDAELVEQTNLINPLQELPLVDFKALGNGVAVVQALLQNAAFQDSFFFREIGLFARDPDTNQEILYSYRNTGAFSPHIPSGNGAVLMQLVLELSTVVDNAQNVTAILDASILFVNQAQFVEHINSPNPHPNFIQVSPDSVNQLDNRLNQVENNVANLFMQLGTADANLLVFEDFTDMQGVDALKVKVLNTVAGTPDVYVEALEGIIAGHYYTISDGIRSAYVRSKALASNDGLFNVIFADNIPYTFNLDKTYLYRSTAIIEGGQASGSSAQKESIFAPDFLWQGISAATPQTLALNTSQSNIANFELSGSGTFDANAFFTLA